MTQKYSDEVLEETPPRAAKLLNGIGAVPVIRTLMQEEGKMTNDDMAEGGKLLLACWGQLPGAKAEQDTEQARQQRAATAELDQWDEPNFARFGAALRRRFPAANDYVFHDLSPSTGAAAVAGVAAFLKRVDALEKGTDPARQGTKEADKAAADLLAARGLTTDERARLDKLVEVAHQPTGTLGPAPEHDASRIAQRKAALTELKDWYEEWSSAARTVVKKRGYLIRMGLANRKMGKKGKGEGEG